MKKKSLTDQIIEEYLQLPPKERAEARAFLRGMVAYREGVPLASAPVDKNLEIKFAFVLGWITARRVHRETKTGKQ